MPHPPRVLLEAAVATVESARTAALAGADRLELCAGLVEGGVTPSVGMICRVRELLDLPLHVLIRPRGGDFLFDGDDCEVMLRDIAQVRAAGCDGVVIGALEPSGRVDRAVTARLAEAARPMSVTFHRAFDLTRDPAEALGDLMALGIDRVLTSGLAPTALGGAAVIAALVVQAAGSITVMAGGGVTAADAPLIVEQTGVRELHVGSSGVKASGMQFERKGVHMGKPYYPDEYRRVETDPSRIREIVRRLSG